MKKLTALATAVVVALLVGVTINVAAQQLDTRDKTFVTFSAPVELPGLNLPAGKYVFRLADTLNRNVIQVYNEDEKDLRGQFLFVNAERMEAADDTIITFKETAEGTTPAVQYWFYPGDRIGKEFIYPKDQAMKIAARTGSTVLSSDGPIEGEAVVSSIDKEGKVTPWERQQRDANAAPAADAVQADAAQPAPASEAPAPAQPTAAAGSLAGNRGMPAEQVDRDSGVSSDAAVGTSGRAAAQAGVSGNAQAETPAESRPNTQRGAAAEGQVAASELPRTASPLPISGLIGLLSLAGGLGLRVARR